MALLSESELSLAVPVTAAVREVPASGGTDRGNGCGSGESSGIIGGKSGNGCADRDISQSRERDKEKK